MKSVWVILLLAAFSASGFFSWSTEIEIHCGININALFFGADSAATDGYDPGIDVPFFSIPTGGYGYFPLDDSLYPYTKLSSDFRLPTADTMIWNIYLENGTDFVLRWDNALLPDTGSFEFGAFEVDSLPDLVVVEWLDMRTCDSMAVFVLGGQIRAVGAPVSAIGESGFRPKAARIDLWPNPFNSTCKISCNGLLDESLEIYDISGRLIDVIPVESGATDYTCNWIPEPEVASGVYFIRAKGSGLARRIAFIR